MFYYEMVLHDYIYCKAGVIESCFLIKMLSVRYSDEDR